MRHYTTLFDNPHYLFMSPLPPGPSFGQGLRHQQLLSGVNAILVLQPVDPHDVVQLPDAGIQFEADSVERIPCLHGVDLVVRRSRRGSLGRAVLVAGGFVRGRGTAGGLSAAGSLAVGTAG